MEDGVEMEEVLGWAILSQRGRLSYLYRSQIHARQRNHPPLFPYRSDPMENTLTIKIQAQPIRMLTTQLKICRLRHKVHQ